MIQAGIADAAIWSVDLQMIGVDVAALSGADVHWTPSAHIGRTDFRLISSQSFFSRCFKVVVQGSPQLGRLDRPTLHRFWQTNWALRVFDTSSQNGN